MSRGDAGEQGKALHLPSERSSFPGRVILCLGDSITQYGFENGGWCLSLQGAYGAKASVVCRGRSGYNSRWALMLESMLPPLQHPPLMVIVWFGANDSVLDGNKQYVPLDEYVSNLKALVAHYSSMGVDPRRVLIVAPSPCELQPSRHPDNTKRYAEGAGRAASESGATLVDMHGEMEARKSNCLRDGVHLSKAGNTVAFNAVLKVVRERLPGLAPQGMPWAHPHWSNVVADAEATRRSIFEGVLADPLPDPDNPFVERT